MTNSNNNTLANNTIHLPSAIIVSSAEKMAKDGPFVELKIQVSSSQLDGKRDAFSELLKTDVSVDFTPSQTALEVDEVPEDDGQTALGLEGKK